MILLPIFCIYYTVYLNLLYLLYNYIIVSQLRTYRLQVTNLQQDTGQHITKIDYYHSEFCFFTFYIFTPILDRFFIFVKTLACLPG